MEKKPCKIEIVNDGSLRSKVYLDGADISNSVRRIEFIGEGGKIPSVKIDFISTDISISTVTIPKLPDVMEGLYIRKEL